MKTLLALSALLWFTATPLASAGSATWSTNPAGGDWNTAANWSPQTVPNTSSDIATFGNSNETQVAVSVVTQIGGINFTKGADAFTISSAIRGLLELSGSGIVNNSGKLQTFLCESNEFSTGAFFFYNSATAGNMTSLGGAGGSSFEFNDFSSAGSAAFDLGGGTVQSHLVFWDFSTAANATILATLTEISFNGASTAANAQITIGDSSFMSINEDAHGGHVVATCMGGNLAYRSEIDIQGNASADEGTYTAIGASAPGQMGSVINLTGSATADHGTFVLNGGLGAGLAATALTFFDTTTAANASITASGGVAGADGAVIFFQKKSKGGTCSITLSGNGELDLSNHSGGLTIGSLAGDGLVFLSNKSLTIGSNNASTSFSGVVQNTGGVTKIGTGTLTLSGANIYTGDTTVSAGVLVANTKRGSSTGTGNVNVNGGTLGGKGIIAGVVTVGTGSGSGAILAPSVGSKQPLTLSLSSLLTLQGDSTYTCQLSSQKAKADEVIAQGVTIASGAQFTLQTVGNKRLPSGTVFTILSNTSATPISGTFADLSDGSTLTAGRHKLLVSYTGGDGNDLTLTVQ